MADIDIFGTLLNKTESGKIAYAQQVWHNGKNKSVQQLIDEIEAGLIDAGGTEVTFVDDEHGYDEPVKATVKFFSESRTIEITTEGGDVFEIGMDGYTSNYNDDFNDDYGAPKQEDYQLKEDPDIEVSGEHTVVGAINSLSRKIGNMPTPTDLLYKGNISLEDLLLITDAPDGLAYSVYSSIGEDGELMKDAYYYAGIIRVAGTRFVRAGGTWIVPDKQPDFTDVVKVEELDDTVYFPIAMRNGAYPNLYGRDAVYGLRLFDLGAFKSEGGIYKPLFEENSRSKSNKWTVYVPYARRYNGGSGSVVSWVYNGGMLDSEDYRRLYEHTHNIDDISGASRVAKSGDYGDLDNTPTFSNGNNGFTVNVAGQSIFVRVTPIFTMDDTPTANSSNAVKSSGIKSALDDKAPLTHTHTKSQITDFPALSRVASSGDYNDLENRPNIPSGIELVTAFPATPSTNNAPCTKLVKDSLDEKAERNHTHTASDITGGVLPASRGGTGQGSLIQACNSLITALDTDVANNVPLDNDYYVSQFRGGTYNTYFRRPFITIWHYIKAKADSVFATIEHTHTKSQITDFPTLATVATSGNYADLNNTPIIRFDFRLANGTDLNTVTWDGMYYADTNSIVNAPTGVERFGLVVLRTSSASSRVQILYASNGDRYERMADVYGTWGTWTKIVDDNIKYSSQSLTPAQQAQARDNIGAGATPDYVVFEQTGSAYNYSFTQISSRGDATIRYDLMGNSASTHDMPICVEINGLETAEDYKDYLRSHVISVIVTGNEQSGLTQIDVFRSAYLFSIPSRKGINILLNEVFEPNTRNRFIVKFEKL